MRLRLPFILLATCLPAVAHAQSMLVVRGDSLFVAGNVFAAESAYYAAVIRDSHDPAARLALGRYLAARGALKVAAVLMEEARYFGGDPKVVALQLAPVYARLWNFSSLATLPSTPLSYAERARAEWLKDNPPVITGDSTDVAWTLGDSASLGTIPVVMGNDTLQATIDPAVTGIVLDSTLFKRPDLHLFHSAANRALADYTATVNDVKLGAVEITNVPARFTRLTGSKLHIGLDVLARFVVTFDPGSQLITLRKDARISGANAITYPTLVMPSGVWLIRNGRPASISSGDGLAMLRSSHWSYDARRGLLIVR